MKKYNFLLSTLLVPAIVLQAGSTCTGGGGGSTPPAVTLPASVTGVQTFNYTTSTLYQFAVNTVSSAGAFTAGTTYGAWCTNHFGTVPGGGVDPLGNITTPVQEDPNNPTGVATYTPMNTYAVTGSGGNYGAPGLTYDATIPGFTTTSLTLAQEWAAVNWILNNPSGVSGETPTTTDTQAAIWQLLHPDDQIGYVVLSAATPTSSLTGASWLLYQDALANGLSFVPTTGQVVGILMLPTTPSDFSGVYQGFVVAVPIACSATGSATFTKTANVTSANAFQSVTYTYTITNTGSTTLQNIVIVDDNGTPGYPEDDVTISAPAGTTLAPGASLRLTSTVYLPISLFYQSGTESAFDTLIPQIIPVPAGSPAGTMPNLLLTYLIDTDVSDNTYGTGASAGWAGNGGHTFAELTESSAEFAFYTPIGNVVSDFTVDYLQNVGKSSTYPSGYKAGLIGKPAVGGTNYIAYLDSTLQDNLNDYAAFNNDTVNSPVAGTPNWETQMGYKIIVNEGVFGICGFGGATVKKNYLAATETGYSGKCGSARSATYTPQVVGSTVKSTAWMTATVCGCTTVVKAEACLSIKLNGCAQPSCNNVAGHQCQQVHCGCGCAKCLAGLHGECTAKVKCEGVSCHCHCYNCTHHNCGHCSQTGCDDPTCHQNGCAHGKVICQVPSQPKPRVVCW